MNNRLSYAILALWLFLLSGCSVTSHLPEGEILYTGVSHIEHLTEDTLDATLRGVIASNLEETPNSAFLGSAYHMSPIPLGLWVYNGLYPKKENGVRHWLWSHFKSDPVLVSTVNPELRAQACEAALKDEGYFDASVCWEMVPDRHDSLCSRLAYQVDYQHRSHFGKITYVPCRDARIDSILHHTLGEGLLHSGDRFSASVLLAEQERITKTLRDSGYFFFKTDYVKFLGDSTQQQNTVNLRVLVGAGADVKALSPCVIDSVHYHLDYGYGFKTEHSDTLRFMTVGYNGPQMVKTRYLRQAMGFRRRARYNPDRIALCKTLISRLNTFKYTTTEFQMLRLAGDTLSEGEIADTTSMRLLIHATYAEPWQGMTEIGCVYKDNQQAGPGATLKAQRRNLWGGGESVTFQLDGSYEWSTGARSQSEGSLVNSFELGTKVSLSVPRLQIPNLFRPSRETPVSSVYSLSFDWMRRAGLFEMIKTSGSVDYGFGLKKANTFVFTPLKLTYVSLVKKSNHFLELIEEYPSLVHSFEDQFIPQLQLSWTYDNASLTQSSPSSQYLNITVAEAGGLCDLLMGTFGSHTEQGERQLFWQPFSQFLKGTAEFRNLYRLSGKLSLASRVLCGIGYAYGNSSVMPYNEQFFIGGPNSLRGFSVRGVGPGNSISFEEDDYSYINRVGEVKLEANAELRFPIVSSLKGALFADAGNVWNISSPSGEDKTSTFSGNIANQIAVDVGLGFRLDLVMLVLRFDIGVPLHDPNASFIGQDERMEHDMRYFNCFDRFYHNLGFNLAVGYPF